MNPIKIDLLSRKRQYIESEVKILSKLLKIKETKIIDEIIERALCHSVQNVISAVIDISQHIIAESTGTVPSTYVECIEQLGDLKVLPPAFAREFSEAVKLRNVVAHLYENLRMDIIWSHTPKLIKDAGKFAAAIKKLEK